MKTIEEINQAQHKKNINRIKRLPEFFPGDVVKGGC